MSLEGRTLFERMAVAQCLVDEPMLAHPAPTGLGRAMAGDSGRTERQANDYYPTPAEVTQALLRRERHCIANVCPGPVWEPCGRGGGIIRALHAEGIETVASDIVPDSEYGVVELDLLTARRPKSTKVVTNPPFALAEKMIWHLLGTLKVKYLALLLKGSYWHAEERTALFRAHRPSRIYALNWRPDFLSKGAPVMECQWAVWQHNAVGTHYDVLERPAPQERLL